MSLIEKSKEDQEQINTLYELDLVYFEHCILKSENLEYSICYCPKLEIYDVILQDFKNSKLINYESRKKLSNSTLEYFNLLKNETKKDNFGNEFKCITHYIEFEI